jgi:TolB-like protein
MGVVYRARDPRLEREVAIKLLPAELSRDPGRLARLRREARTTAALSHPNLLAIHDIGDHLGVPYLVCELLEGESLRERLAGHPIQWREALSITRDVASGLAAAHGRGIVHRDLKPGNIFLLEDGRAKILDFGLAALGSAEGLEATGLSSAQTLDKLTVEGVVLGTVGYMAPEQARGASSDARSDLFALGVVLYEMVTGRAPFHRDSAVESLHAILHEQPEPITNLVEALPRGLDRLVLRLLEKEPSRRYPSARDLLYDLDGVERGGDEAPAPPASGRRGASLPLVAVGLVAAAALALGLWRWAAGGGAPSPPSAPHSAGPIAVAVLPFEERGGPTTASHLALALPDEIVTELTYVKGLVVRSFTQSSRFTPPVEELAEVAELLGADHLVVGQFGVEGESVRVSVEAIDVAANQVVWRDSWGTAGEGLLALREELHSRISGGLVSALGESLSVEEAGSGPGNAEAYDLYLRAATRPYEATSNREAIAMLERSLDLDPGFAQAWLELSDRHHWAALLTEGGDPSGAGHAYEYTRRALELDPNSLEARLALLRRDTERGSLAAAFQEAVDLVRRRPDSSPARVALAYVLRYGGALEESAGECEQARRLDLRNRGVARCHWTFAHLGLYERAIEYVDLLPDTMESLRISLRVDMLMRMRDLERALVEAGGVGDDLAGGDIQRACISGEKPAELARWVGEREAAYSQWADPEALYWYAALLADCGFPETALRFLALSIDRGYCVAAALDNDPLWEPLRDDPRFLAQRLRSRACHERFMSERSG